MSRSYNIRERAPLLSLLAAMGISLTGNTISLVAVPLLAKQMTGSVVLAGVAVLFNTAPIVLSAFLGGPLVDRAGARAVSIFGDMASAVSLFAIAALYMAGSLEFWMLAGLVFLRGVFDTSSETARMTMLPEAAEASGVDIDRANSWFEVIERGPRLVGGAIAFFAYKHASLASLLYFDAASYLMSALLVTLAIPLVVGKARAFEAGYLTELASGIRYVISDRLVIAVAVTVAISNMLETPLLTFVAPVVGKSAGNGGIAGLLFTVSGLGIILGALAYPWLARRFTKRALLFWLVLLSSLKLLVFAFIPAGPWLIVGVFLSFIAEGPLNPLLTVILLTRIPAEIRGRVMGALIAGTAIALPLGAPLYGFGVEYLGLTTTLMIAFAFNGMMIAYLGLSATVRQVNELETTEETPELSHAPIATVSRPAGQAWRYRPGRQGSQEAEPVYAWATPEAGEWHWSPSTGWIPAENEAPAPEPVGPAAH